MKQQIPGFRGPVTDKKQTGNGGHKAHRGTLTVPAGVERRATGAGDRGCHGGGFRSK